MPPVSPGGIYFCRTTAMGQFKVTTIVVVVIYIYVFTTTTIVVTLQ